MLRILRCVLDIARNGKIRKVVKRTVVGGTVQRMPPPISQTIETYTWNNGVHYERRSAPLPPSPPPPSDPPAHPDPDVKYRAQLERAVQFLQELYDQI